MRDFQKTVLLAIFISCFSFSVSVSGLGDNVTGSIWQNWNGQVQAVPKTIYEPSSLSELQAIVQDAKARNIEVKATGASHSLSEIVQTNGYLIKTFNLNTVSIVDSTQFLVRCQTGITIRDLDNFLDANGMVIGTGTLLDDITIGGSVAAGCHGTGKSYSIISDLVQEIRIVDSNGNLQTYAGSALNAAKVNLGLLGIIYDMVLKVEAARNVHEVAQAVPYSSIINATFLQATFNAHDSLEIYYFPFASSVQVRTTDATNLSSTFNYTEYVISGETTVAVGLEYAPIFEAYPSVLYEVGTSGFSIFANIDDIRPLRYAVHYGYNEQNGPPFFNPEYVFGFNTNQFPLMANAISDAVNLIYSYYNNYGLAPVTYGLNIRFTKPSSSILSPANTNTDYCMWMDVLLGVNAANTTEFMSDIYNLFTSPKYNAAPHWPKDWSQIPTSRDNNIRRFLTNRKLLDVDPSNIFVNDALFRLFSNKLALFL